jgi:hypothetical protein
MLATYDNNQIEKKERKKERKTDVHHVDRYLLYSQHGRICFYVVSTVIVSDNSTFDKVDTVQVPSTKNITKHRRQKAIIPTLNGGNIRE